MSTIQSDEIGVNPSRDQWGDIRTADRTRSRVRDHVAYGWVKSPFGDYTPEQLAIYNAAYDAALAAKKERAQ